MLNRIHTSDAASHAHLLFAHGAGASGAHPVMGAIAEAFRAHGIATTRFDFDFMAARAAGGTRRPPPKMPQLENEFAAALLALQQQPCARCATRPLLLGGKSMGGRVATLIADRAFERHTITAVVVVGYPFHPARRRTVLRTAHLETLCCPTLIHQGTRDAMGTRAEVTTYSLSSKITMHWLEDGDHDLKPRVKSGLTHGDHLTGMAQRTAAFIANLTPEQRRGLTS